MLFRGKGERDQFIRRYTVRSRRGDRTLPGPTFKARSLHNKKGVSDKKCGRWKDLVDR